MISRRSGVLALGVLLLLAAVVFHRKDEVTVYPVACVKGYVLENVCYGESVYPLNRSRYTALAAGQLVMEQFDLDGAPVDKLNDYYTCTVRDGSNWTCRDDKEGLSLTMQAGMMHHSPANHIPEDSDAWENTFYVHWWQWHCLSAKKEMVTPAMHSCFIPLYPLSQLNPSIRAQLRAEAQREWAADRAAFGGSTATHVGGR